MSKRDHNNHKNTHASTNAWYQYHRHAHTPQCAVLTPNDTKVSSLILLYSHQLGRWARATVYYGLRPLLLFTINVLSKSTRKARSNYNRSHRLDSVSSQACGWDRFIKMMRVLLQKREECETKSESSNTFRVRSYFILRGRAGEILTNFCSTFPARSTIFLSGGFESTP